MRIHKMTKWDEGQILIKAHDTLAECAEELLPTQPEFAKILHEMALDIGSMFNEFESHKFGLPSNEDKNEPS